ncbi:MAG: hypothetical protein QE263_05175 [Vampirovibrionales bacterium]|nr:hypothetical protein [Vampirovibrionales bacterium]
MPLHSLAQLTDRDGVRPIGFQAESTTPGSSGNPARFHKQIQWNRIKAFLNEATEEGVDTTAPQQASPTANKPPTGWNSEQVSQLGRYEATIYGRTYALQLHGPDTPDKRIRRIEQTLHMGALLATTEQRLTRLKTQMEALHIPTADGDQKKVSDWAIALMEARVFQGTAPNQSTEQRVQALEVAVFGIPSTDLSPVSLTANVPVPETTTEPSLAKRVALLGEQFPVRLRSLPEGRPSAGQAATLASAPEQAGVELDEVEFVADTLPALAAKPKALPPTITPKTTTKEAPKTPAVVSIATTPIKPEAPVWFKQHSGNATPSSVTSPQTVVSSPPQEPSTPPMEWPIMAAVTAPTLPPLPQSTQQLWEDSSTTEPLHVFVASSSPEELHSVLLALDAAAAIQPLQVVRFSQLADVWITGSVATPLPPGLSPHRVLRLQRDCAVSTRAAVPWGTCMQQWLSAHRP